VALGELDEVMGALVVSCSMARRMHSWSYSGFALSALCHEHVALLLVGNIKSSQYKCQ
jgi:hypothetical protein